MMLNAATSSGSQGPKPEPSHMSSGCATEFHLYLSRLVL